jgi:hypothetical protein
MSDVVHGGRIASDQWVERQRTLRRHKTFPKVRRREGAKPRQQPDAERRGGDADEQRRSDDLEASSPTQAR